MKHLLVNQFILLTCFFCSLNFNLKAQQRVISGTITRESKPQSNVDISIKGHPEIHVKTDENGHYSIPVVTKNDILLIKQVNKAKAISMQIDNSNNLLNLALESVEGQYLWKIDPSLSLNSSYFSTYQASGNSNNLYTIIAKLNGSLTWRKGKNTWINSLNCMFGQSHTTIRIEDADGIRLKGVNTKNGDQLMFATEYRIPLGKVKNFYWEAEADFRSQFSVGHRDPFAEAYGRPVHVISHFMSPGTVNFGIGIDYAPNSNFNLYYSPLNIESMFVKDESLRKFYNVFDGDHTKEIGSYLRMSWRQKIMEGIEYSTKLQMFTNYLKNKKHPLAERPGSVDVQLWQNNLTFSFNKYIALNFSANISYDEDDEFDILENNSKTGKETGKVGPRVVYFHNIGLQFNYKFANKK